MQPRLIRSALVAVVVLAQFACTRSTPAANNAEAESAASQHPRSDPSLQPCIDRELVERRLGLFSAVLEGASLRVRPRALLRGVRATSALAATDRGLVLGGYGELIAFTPDGAWTRVAIGREDVVLALLVADLDRDADEDVVALVERSITMHDEQEGDTASSLPFALALERTEHGFSLRATIALQTDSTGPVALADVTGDGVPDLVAFEISQPVVYRSDGAFGFARTLAGPRFDEPLLNNLCNTIDVFDRDGDGDLDLRAICSDGGSTRHALPLLDNLGNGRFALQSGSERAQPGTRTSTAPRDLDADGKPDMLLAYLDAHAEPVLALASDVTQPAITVRAPLTLPAGALGSTGSVPSLTLAHDRAGRSLAVVWPAYSAVMTTLSVGTQEGEALRIEQHALAVSQRAAQLVTNEAASEPPTVYTLIDLACRPACSETCEQCLFERCVDGPYFE